MELARFYTSGGDFSRAVKHYEIVVENLADSPEAHHNLGDLYLRLGQSGRARAAYEQALVLAPNLGPTHAALGKLYLQQGDERQALAAFERARAAGARVDPATLRRLRARHPTGSSLDSPPPGSGGGV
jgi:tetratricopeptide (TPR) repeat protein